MRQRFDHRRVDRQQRVEQVGEADALCLGRQAEERAVAVEAPRPPVRNRLDPGLGVAVQQLAGQRAVRRPAGHIDRFRTEPLHADHRDEAVRQQPADHQARAQVFEAHAESHDTAFPRRRFVDT